jgi:hypothetical protein
MKNTMKILLILFFAFAGLSLADTTLTIIIPAADEARMTEAFGSILNLKDANGNPRPANAQEVEGAITVWLTGQTTDYEKRKNMVQFSPPPLELLPPQSAGSPIPGKAAAPTATPKKK